MNQIVPVGERFGQVAFASDRFFVRKVDVTHALERGLQLKRECGDDVSHIDFGKDFV